MDKHLYSLWRNSKLLHEVAFDVSLKIEFSRPEKQEELEMKIGFAKEVAEGFLEAVKKYQGEK